MATQAEKRAAASAIAGTHAGHKDTLPFRLIERQAAAALAAAEKVRG